MVNDSTDRNTGIGYYVDQILTLTLNLDPDPDHREKLQPAVLKIQAIYTNTLSCTMAATVVQSEEFGPGRLVFIKLFDWRFSDKLREEYDVEPWMQLLHDAYVSFALSFGQLQQFLSMLHGVPNFEEKTGDSWHDGLVETFIADKAFSLYKTEVSVYRKLRELQGSKIPSLLATVNMDITPAGVPYQDIHAGDFEPFTVKGLMLEHIEGHDLFSIPQRCPRSSWQDIVDRAVATVRMLGNYGILNEDVSPRNFVVSHRTIASGGKKAYCLFMVDFALCQFRGDKSDAEWGRAKWLEDEDGAVGLRMQKRLKKKHGFALRYVPSDQYSQWASTTE